MKLSVIVPCFNETGVIQQFYEELSKTLKGKKITHEIIIVDDGSLDDSGSKIKEISKNDKMVKSITFSKNFGKEAAMYAGLEHAKGEYVAIIDADLQQKPEVLVEMYEKLLENKEYDSVAAYRESYSDESKLKRALTAVFYKIMNNISSVKLLPGASDFRVFKASVKDAILSLKEHKRFLKGIFSWIGFNTIYVPYSPEKRVYGKSKWSITVLINYALGGIVSFSTKPLKYVLIASIIVSVIGVLNFILFGNLGFRMIILILSLIMLSFGVISLYIIRIYDNTLNRPLYIIKEKSGFDK
ncbi:MAG: glycosyltransferase family 2 protein [Bacilli bacterium]